MLAGMKFEVYTPEGSTTYTGNARYDIEHPGAGPFLAWAHDGDTCVPRNSVGSGDGIGHRRW